jgi:hypothetical protein
VSQEVFDPATACLEGRISRPQSALEQLYQNFCAKTREAGGLPQSRRLPFDPRLVGGVTSRCSLFSPHICQIHGQLGYPTILKRIHCNLKKRALRAALRGREPARRRLSRRVDGGWGSAAGRSAAGHNCYGPGRASARQQCDIIKATPRGMSNILPLEENNAWLWNIRK